MEAVNTKFKRYLIKLKDEYNIKQTEIADNLQVTKFKLTDIKSGRSTADKSMLDNLLRFYPFLMEAKTLTKDINYLQLSKELVSLQKENEKLRRENDKLREVTRVKKTEIEKLIEEKIETYLKKI